MRVDIGLAPRDRDASYCPQKPGNSKEARGVLWWILTEPHQLLEEGVAFARGHEVWVMEWGNNADYVCTGLVADGALHDDPEGDLPPTPSEADDPPC